MPSSSQSDTKSTSSDEKETTKEEVKKLMFSDAILQTLDREVGGYYLTSAPYGEAISKWKGIPIVYAKEHPDPKLFSTNPEKALKKVNGKVVGEVVNAWMEKTGHPRAMAQFGFTDEGMVKLKDEGKLSHSTSFFARIDKKHLVGDVTPNHVLVFEETETDLPKDSGAFILNKQEKCPQIVCNKVKELPFAGFGDWDDCMAKQSEKYDEETASKVCGKLKAKFEGKTPTNEEIAAEMKEFVQIRPSTEDVKMPEETDVKMKEEQIAVLNKTIADKDAEIVSLKAKVETYEKEKAEAEWVSMKADLPVGMIHKPEDESALRTEWDENPKAFAKRLIALKKPDLPKKEGSEVIDEKVEFKKLDEKWKAGGGY
jgi:hypothetical protein